MATWLLGESVMNRRTMALNVALLLAVAHLAGAQWGPVAPGIEYREFTLDGPIRAFVARAERSKDNWTIDTMIGQGMLRTGLETVSGMAERYDDAINFQGQCYDVKVAVNGDYFSFKTQQIAGGQIIGGWLVRRFGSYGGGSGFVWKTNRQCLLGGNVSNKKELQHVAFSDFTEVEITEINRERGSNELILFTPHYAERTYTTNGGVEVLVQVPEPVGLLAKGGQIKGTIRAVEQRNGSTPILFDQVVLSGHGTAGATLLHHAQVGQQVGISLGMEDHGVEEVGMPPADWQGAYASTGGRFYCVVAGKVPAERWEREKTPGAVNRHPRTATAMNDKYVYFVVVDGRSQQSVGMTITELGDFCKEQLQATYAIAQDGGGSSTMWVEGQVKNVPSDGHERAVGNGNMIALVLAPRRSGSFSAGDKVETKEGGQLRLGPGTNYGVLAEVAGSEAGVIVEHSLNGIYAKGEQWWQCRLERTEGWLPEAILAKSR